MFTTMTSLSSALPPLADGQARLRAAETALSQAYTDARLAAYRPDSLELAALDHAEDVYQLVKQDLQAELALLRRP